MDRGFHAIGVKSAPGGQPGGYSAQVSDFPPPSENILAWRLELQWLDVIGCAVFPSVFFPQLAHARPDSRENVRNDRAMYVVLFVALV